ncbi:MAG: glycosyltransferase family 10 [Pseudomonadota bacterium]|nr:glycosyltransferase family 10 [Pseudomonadota bacterium]
MGDIVVKVLSKYELDRERTGLEALPGVRFVFDDDSAYDWMVVYDDLPSISGESLSLSSELISCDPSRTILLTYEPSSIKFYGYDYVRQFAHVLTSHEVACLSHPNRHDVPPVGLWYYGSHSDAQSLSVPPIKTRNVSVFYSGKTMSHSLHDLRHRFITGMMNRFGDNLSVYGRGYQPVEKKKTALDSYRYHIAMENHRGPHHWTEKLSDCYLGYCMPIYAGCTNVGDYFPKNSYIQVDPRCVDSAYDRITQAIAEGYYEKNISAIIEARQRVLSRYSLGRILSEYVLNCESNVSGLITPFRGSDVIYSRHLLMHKKPLAFLRYAVGKVFSRRYHRLKWRKYSQLLD